MNPESPKIISKQEQCYINCVTQAIAARVEFVNAKAVMEAHDRKFYNGKKLPHFCIKQAS